MPLPMSLFDRSLSVCSWLRARRAPLVATTVAATIAGICGSANATWSILIADMRTGEIVIGSATCVESINLQHETPVLISGIGAVTAQSAVDTTGRNRQIIRDRLLQGVPLEAILEELSMSDAGHDNRQYGMIDTFGETLTYSGVQNAQWAGGMTGRIERGRLGPADDIVYSVQGNILSGGNVVPAAVDAIVASDGDLPAMLMAGMQAAKSAGGDGRCSCSNADPTGCGSPPPGPFKSADVGYMLGTRADDIDAIRAIYPIEGFVGAIETMDLDGDGYEEVIVGNRDTNEISIFRNTSTQGVPLSSLELMGTIDAPASGIVAMQLLRAGDFNATPKLLVALADPPKLIVYQGDGSGSLTQTQSFELPGVPSDLDTSNSNPARVAVAIEGTPGISSYLTEANMVEPLEEFSLGFVPAGMALADVVGKYYNDLIVTDPGANLIHIYGGGELGHGSGIYTIPTANDPIKVTAADMDNDGDNEILVLCGSGRAIQIFNFENDAWTLWSSINIGGVGIGMDVGDMNGDGFPDVVSTVAASNRNLRLWINDGLGGFALQTRTRVGSAAGSIALSDMNNNGDLDLVVGNAGDEAIVVLDNPRGGDLPQPGRFAEGSYFLELNVPNQRRSDPDPVDQLQSLYNDWLLTRQGRVDAVRSTISGRKRIPVGGVGSLRIELRDLNGDLLSTTDPTEIEVVSDDRFTPGAVSMISPGIFEVQISAGAEIGPGAMVVSAGPSGDRVSLMPRVDLYATNTIADMNADGICNFYDVSQFLIAFNNAEPDADLNNDGVIDFLDVSAYLKGFNACFGG